LTGNLLVHMTEELQYWDLESLTDSRVDRELAHIDNCTQLLWQPPQSRRSRACLDQWLPSGVAVFGQAELHGGPGMIPWCGRSAPPYAAPGSNRRRMGCPVTAAISS
jgi:hypothetical protein